MQGCVILSWCISGNKYGRKKSKWIQVCKSRIQVKNCRSLFVRQVMKKEEFSRMSAERTLNLEVVVFIVIQNSCRDGGGADKVVTLVAKMVYGKMSARSWYLMRPSPIRGAFLQTSCRTLFSPQIQLIVLRCMFIDYIHQPIHREKVSSDLEINCVFPR